MNKFITQSQKDNNMKKFIKAELDQVKSGFNINLIRYYSSTEKFPLRACRIGRIGAELCDDPKDQEFALEVANKIVNLINSSPSSPARLDLLDLIDFERNRVSEDAKLTAKEAKDKTKKVKKNEW